ALLEVLRVIREVEPPRPSTRLSSTDELPSISARRQTEPARLKRLVRGELDWIVMKALEKDRGRRYETANALAVDVQRHLADEPVLAGPPSALYRFRKFARRNRGAVIAAGLVLLALVAGVGGTTWQALQATRERDAKQRALVQARLLSAELAYDKGQLLGEQGDADLALLWLARSLELAPPDAVPLQAAIRSGLGAWRRQVNSVRLALPHDGMVPAVALPLAPNGTAVIANWNPVAGLVTVQRWHPGTGRPEEPQTVSSPAGFGLVCCAFSPKADYLLLGFRDRTDGVIELVDLITRKSVWEPIQLRGEYPVSAAFSPDGRIVVLGLAVGPEKGKAQLFDFATGMERGPALDHGRPVQAIAFHPDGKTFVTECGEWGNATEQVESRFWDLDGRETRPALKHTCMALAVAFSPDGRRLLTGHWDFKARLWELDGNAEPVVLQHSGSVVSVAFSPDWETLLTGSLDGTIWFWDRTGQRLAPPLRHSSLVQAAALAPDGKSALVGVRAANASRLWNLAALDRTRQQAGRTDSVTLAISPDRRTLLPRGAGHAVQLQDAATGRAVGKPLPHRNPVPIVGASVPPGKPHACSSDGLRAVTVDRDNVARLWNTTTGESVELRPDSEQARQSIFYAAAFSPDGRYFATGNFDATVHVWEAATGRLVHTLKHEWQGPVFAVAFTPTGRTLVTGGADGTVRFWDTMTGEPLGSPIRHGTAVLALAISPDGNTVASVGIDPNVHLWHLETRDRRQRLSGHQGGVNDLAFSPDGRFVVSGG
ncbi:MAG TPA: hypothetical protein VKD90_18535, partial [Gemmataceae bacterium]|nr:hypothetical protein [Gemmataceae bacterium]